MANGIASPFAKAGTGIKNYVVDHTSEGARHALKNTGRNIANHVKPIGAAVKYVAPKAAGLVARTAVKGTLVGAGAVAGLAAGLVSDDLSNTVKWSAAGAVSGLASGSAITSIPGRARGVGNEINEAVERQYEATHTKDEIEARQNARADALALEDKDRIRMYQDKLTVSSKEARRIMAEDAQKYRENGVTDDKIIIKAMKADGFGDDKTSHERILLAKLATEVGGNRKQLDQVEKGLTKRGISKSDVDKYVDKIRDFNDWA